GTGTTPLVRAAKAADVAAMRLLIEYGADARIATGSIAPDETAAPAAAPRRGFGGGINPLMAAAGLGSKEEDTTGRFKTEPDIIEAIRICLAAGVDINAADN